MDKRDWITSENVLLSLLLSVALFFVGFYLSNITSSCEIMTSTVLENGITKTKAVEICG